MPNPEAFPLARLRAGAPAVGRERDDSGGARRADRERIVAGLMLSGFLTEACLMGRIAGGPYEAGGAVAGFALLFLAWYWLSLGCLLQAGLRLVAALVRGRNWAASLLAGLALAVVLTGAGLAYATSWAICLRSGRFATAEAFTFALANARMLWLYLGQAEPEVLYLLAALPIVATAGLATALWLDSRRSATATATGTGKGAAVSPHLWGSVMLLWVVTLPAISLDRSASRRALNLDVLASRLNPPMAMLVSARAALLDEPIEACLDVSELEAIATEATTGATATTAAAGPRPPSVILLAVESLRHDVVQLARGGVEVMPNLSALARGGLHLTRAYAQSTHSDYSDVCIGSSLYPLRTRGHHYYRADDPWPKTTIWDLLKPEGYATAIVSSQNEAWGGMDQFLMGPNLDLFYDARSSVETSHTSDLDTGFAAEIHAGGLRAGKLDDGQTTDVAIAWVSGCAGRGEPFFLRLNYQDAHFPYEIAEGAARPFQPCAIDFPASFLGYPEDKVDVVRNAYFNALHESDRQIGRLVEALRRLGRLHDTILVVYGENGEAFHENGAVCHAGVPVEPAIRVACVIHAPDLVKPRVEPYPLELIDVVPTVLGMMGQPSHPNFQGIDILAPGRVPVEDRLLFFHAENAIARADAVLLGGRWKYHHDRAAGRTALYDVATDPNESRDLSDEHPALAERLRETLARWRARQLAYYHYSHYYRDYYPPQPPKWSEPGHRAGPHSQPTL